MSLTNKPYGYRVVYERQLGGRAERAFFGTTAIQSKARAKAMIKQGYLRCVQIESLTKAQFIDAFPPGRSRRGVKNFLHNRRTNNRQA